MDVILSGDVIMTLLTNLELVKKGIVIVNTVGLRLKNLATTLIIVPLITVILQLKVMCANMSLFVVMITTLVPLITATLPLVVLMLLMLNVKRRVLATWQLAKKESDVSLLISVKCVDLEMKLKANV
jgi:hypothetical protein